MATKLKLDNLHVGDVIKNYEDMCELLGETIYPSSDRKKRTAQYDKWRRYINYDRKGNKFIINEIYDKPLPAKKQPLIKRDELGGTEKWEELCDYVRDEILQLPQDTVLPRPFILRLDGLSRGNFISNNAIKPLGRYQYQDILTAFKMAKAITKKTDFADDEHRFNYAMIIVEKKINDVVKARKSKEKVTTKVENLDVGVHMSEKATYQPTSVDLSQNEIFDKIW